MNIKKFKKSLALSKQAFWEYKIKIIFLTILAMFGSFFEAIGVNTIIPLFSSVVKSDNQGTDAISLYLKKVFSYFGVDFSIKFLLIFICILFILKALILLFISYYNIKISVEYEKNTRLKLLKKTLHSKWSHLINQKLGHLEAILLIDVNYGSALLLTISNIFFILSGLIIYLIVAVNISFTITAISLFVGLFIMLILKPTIKNFRSNSKKIPKINKNINHFINETLSGIKVIKSMSVENKIKDIGEKYFCDLEKLKLKIQLYKKATSSLFQPVGLIFICILFAISYKTPNFNLASLVAIAYLIQRIFTYIQQLQSSFFMAITATPHLADILSFEKTADSLKEKNTGSKKFNLKEKLEFKNINFTYQKTSKKILSNINFTINKGEMIGLIGPSGAGKTTLVDIILGLLETNGEIKLDNYNISKYDINNWRNNIGYISQDIFLTNDSILNNIKFYNENLKIQEIKNAAKLANIDDFIESSPEKYDTIIGERGIKLSAGQRQRIIIARILAKNPQFLILDEATSALDNESEVKIQKIIEKLKGKITVFVIAHRLSTIINVDRLLVLDKGEIIEQGTPKELLNNTSTYFYKVYNIRN